MTYEAASTIIDALLPLLPGCCSKDPLKGRWDQIEQFEPENYRDYLKLFERGLIDCFGNLTDDGLAIYKLCEDVMNHEIEQGISELEMAEMDKLDETCRRRPSYLRVEPHYYEDFEGTIA